MRTFFQRWGMPIFLTLACLMMASMWIEDRRVLAAKIRIASDRRAIAETRDKVLLIEQQIREGHVPEKIDRLERSFGVAVEENRRAIQRLREHQQALREAIAEGLGLSPEENDAQDDSPDQMTPKK